MTLPSIKEVARERGIDLAKITPEDQESILVEAMRRDLGPGVEYIHKKAHEAKETGQPVFWSEDPNSPLGKLLTRIHASDALRPLASKHFAHGLKLNFVNCCSGAVGWGEGQNLQLFQIQTQDGTIATADC